MMNTYCGKSISGNIYIYIYMFEVLLHLWDLKDPNLKLYKFTDHLVCFGRVMYV